VVFKRNLDLLQVNRCTIPSSIRHNTVLHFCANPYPHVNSVLADRSAGPASMANSSSGAEDAESASSDGEQVPPVQLKEPPQRSRQLQDLLRSAGYGEEAAAAPAGVEVCAILTCDSKSPSENFLYVCSRWVAV
jgi:hypothetical protein